MSSPFTHTRKRLKALHQAGTIDKARLNTHLSTESMNMVGVSRLSVLLGLDPKVLLQHGDVIACHAKYRHAYDPALTVYGATYASGYVECFETCGRCKTLRTTVRAANDYTNTLGQPTYKHESGYDFDGKAKRLGSKEFVMTSNYLDLLTIIGKLEAGTKAQLEDKAGGLSLVRDSTA